MQIRVFNEGIYLYSNAAVYQITSKNHPAKPYLFYLLCFIYYYHSKLHAYSSNIKIIMFKKKDYLTFHYITHNVQNTTEIVKEEKKPSSKSN